MEMWGLAAPPVPVLSHTACHRHKAQRSLGGQQTPGCCLDGNSLPCSPVLPRPSMAPPSSYTPPGSSALSTEGSTAAPSSTETLLLSGGG